MSAGSMHPATRRPGPLRRFANDAPRVRQFAMRTVSTRAPVLGSLSLRTMQITTRFASLVTLLITAGCSVPSPSEPPAETVGTTSARLSTSDPALGLTADFRAFLAGNPTYASFDFARGDLGGTTSYGGRVAAGDAVTHEPIVFVHGNSDRGVGGTYGGWNASIDEALARGYGPQEIYAFTWGDADAALTAYQYHSEENLKRVRAFFQAVLAYTGAAKIDVVAHSMGVTLARKAILGGSASDALGDGSYNLGASLGGQVDTFLGISGANVGLTSCWYTGPSTPTCGATNGFYPGTSNGFIVTGRSAFLNDLLAKRGEASYVASMWSSGDEVLGTGALVWGVNTARVPGQNGERQLDSRCGHFASKNGTAAAQIAIVTGHQPSMAPSGCP